MKILYFSYLADIKGISLGSANKAIGFLEGLRQLGHDVHVNWRGCQSRDTKREAYEKRVQSPIRKVLRKYYFEPNLLLSNIKHIIQESIIIGKVNPDVIISRLSFLRFSSLMLSKRKRIPFLLEADCPPNYENDKLYSKQHLHLRKISEYIELKNLLHADAVIVVSSILRDYFLDKGVPRDKIFVVPNGADPSVFYPRAKDVELKKTFQLADECVVGWIGSGWQWSECIIEMVEKILTQRKDVKFLFIGGIQDKIQLQQLSRKPGFSEHIILKGYVPYNDIPRYLSVMDIVIAPYPMLKFWYPSSIKVFEYMASGKSVVASAGGQLKEVIKEGYNGYLFDPDIKDDLTHKVTALLDSPGLRQTLGDNALKTILENYTWKHHAETIDGIINQMIKK
jgi:glycosyltransferase involved in cell wall biosynthesis